jgi:signal transduction histidine kinase
MPVSKRFLSLVNFQLAQFADRADVTSLVVYVTEPDGAGTPDLIPVGQWPASGRVLPPLAADANLRSPAERRRWLALRHGGVLLGALQVETTALPWPTALGQRLQAVSHCLTEGLCLDHEYRRLQLRLDHQQEQLKVLLHQLRNPLAALRTFGQLLLRRLEHDPRNRPLVEGLLQEERQLLRYVDAIDALERPGPVFSPGDNSAPLLLPPSLGDQGDQALEPLLAPLLQRAAATAALQGRPWHGPQQWPHWCGDAGAVAEILANLLENAFRYSPPGAAVGLHVAPMASGGWELCVWDGGEPIATAEQERIFEPGARGHNNTDQPGSGLGLALARQLAQRLGGDLRLATRPSSVAPTLPEQGNAFLLRLPASAPPGP